MSLWSPLLLVGMFGLVGCSGDYNRVRKAFDYQQNDTQAKQPVDFGVPYRVNDLSNERRSLVFSGVHVPAPRGFENAPAVYIPKIELKMADKAPGSVHVIRELIIQQPQLSIDWTDNGSNLDVLYYALLLTLRAEDSGVKRNWALDRLTIRGGFVNAPDEWLGRERIDIPFQPYSADSVIDSKEPVSSMELTERCAGLFVQAVRESIDSFDKEMQLVDQAVEANLAQYFGSD